MATRNCSVCELKGKTSTPEVWCPQCEKSLCITCHQHHQVQRATKDHSTLSYEDYRKLPPFILNVPLICEEHNEKYQYFCRSHDIPLCKKCLSKSHKKCDDIPDIDDVIQNVKTSAIFEDVWRDVKATHQTLLNAVRDRQENLENLQKKKEDISTQVKTRICRLTDQLRKLESSLLSKLDSVVNENGNQICSTTKILKSKERKLHEIMGQKDLIKKHASNFQTFIGIKQMERDIQDSEETLQKLAEKGEMNNTKIEIEENYLVEDNIFGIKTLGEIKIKSEKKTIPLDKDKPNTAQKMVETRFPKQLTLKHQFTLDESFYSGCCTLPNGLMVFVDNRSKEVKVLKSDGSLQSSVRFKGRGGEYDVSVINGNHVAVSHLGPTISIIDISSSKVIKTLKTKSIVRGITHHDGHLFYCADGLGIKKVNIDTGKIDKVYDDRSVGYYSYIDTDGNRICYLCYGTVTVLDSDYRVIFTFEDDNILSEVRGISMDQHQNMFVCDQNKNNLLLISRDGDKYEVVASKDNGLNHPYCVHYDKDNKEVLVVSVSGVARIFTVK